MKPLKELKENLHYLKAQRIGIEIRTLLRKNIDFEVYLPTFGKNLQRDYVWNIEQKRELIWSILYERNIPNISLFVYEIDGVDIVEVIDGKQRLSTVLNFCNDKFTIEIEGKEYLYYELPQDYQIAIRTFYFNAFVIYDRLTDMQKVEWFNLINFSGTKH